MTRALDGPHIGLGHCLELVDDKVGNVEVQCCRFKPGNADLLMTGNLSAISKSVIENLLGLVEMSIPAIAARLGLPAADGLSLMKHGQDLHVHVVNRHQPIESTYHMGAIYVALVSLLIGRRARADTTVFGDVANAYATFSSIWDLNVNHIMQCQSGGYRHAILAKGTEVDAEATAAAAVIQEDGRPLVELHTVGHILDVLHYVSVMAEVVCCDGIECKREGTSFQGE